MQKDVEVARSLADAASAAGKWTAVLSGSGAAAAGWLGSAEGRAAVGALVALGGLVVQSPLGVRRDRREQREHEARMRHIEAQALHDDAAV